MYPVLLSRFVPVVLPESQLTKLHSSLDPLLGVFTGALAYYLYETNPRTAPDQKLIELTRWKWSDWKRARDKTADNLDAAD